jgi:hypothetical protein
VRPNLPPVVGLATTPLVGALATILVALVLTHPDRHARGLLAAIAAIAAIGLLSAWVRVAVGLGRVADGVPVDGRASVDDRVPMGDRVPVESGAPVDDGRGGSGPVE